ncbi:type I pullulanase [Gorillibacterium massiliense]|uniref:type I pullulanase n=1 Tax=Gorillibacterium massiliense TaxID=1280390 RepID=UPI0004B94D60|nr:type I pullulanase [Gorillibacterium massiliense]
MAVQQAIDYEIHYGDLEVSDGISVFSPAFDDRFYYDGDDLGMTYSTEGMSCKLWAPTAWEAKLVLYSTWDGDPQHELDMTRTDKGCWQREVEGDWEGWFYTYKVKIGDAWNEAADPYAKAVCINGEKGAIVDPAKTNPSRWTHDKPKLDSVLDAVIYEGHIRDMTIHPESGVRHKGKYLGLAEAGTKGPMGIETGLDHIVHLGVTHLQLLPIHDFCPISVDERFPDERYNWGYDPQNYNTPEGSYALDPYNPCSRIRELKELIQTLHDHGLRVILDVVYNHVYDGYRVNFTKLVPGYYLRYLEDGSLSDGAHCGNEFASERKMARKFILDTVLYWTKEYHVDGFRFDLMGLTDVETMQEIRRNLDAIDPSILLLGEGWYMETSLPAEKRANQFHAGMMPGIGQFNDKLRNAVKGNIFNPTSGGFISGEATETELKKGITGAIYYNESIHSFAPQPDQAIHYVECHDNHTLWDRLKLVHPDKPEEWLNASHRLATAIVITSQGIPFIHAGQEFMRTKFGEENSYKSPDSINRLDWNRCAMRQNDVEYVRQLLILRKLHPAFRLRNADDIRSHLRFEEVPPGCVAFTLMEHAGGDPAKHLYVIYHSNRSFTEVTLPQLGEWQLVFGSEHLADWDQQTLNLKNIGMVVLEVTE